MKWSSYIPTSEYKKVAEYFQEDAGFLLDDLKENRLEVILINAPEQRFCSHKIRAKVKDNPQWYRDLYHSTPHFRRNRCLRALHRIKEGIDRRFRVSPYKYDSIMRDLIFSRLTQGFEYRGEFIPPVNKVRYFFDLRLLEEALEYRCLL